MDKAALSPSIPSPYPDLAGSPPWIADDIFPPAPVGATYGYNLDNTLTACSQYDLVEQLRRDTDRKIKLVWSPESAYLTPPEQVPTLFDAVHERHRAYHKQLRTYAIGSIVLWGMIVGVELLDAGNIAQFPLFNLVVLGVIPVIDHTWNLYRLRAYTPSTMAQSVAEARYWAWVAKFRAPWMWMLAAMIAVIGVVQFLNGMRFLGDRSHSSVLAAGIVKQALREGEVWRLLTGTLLHANILHFLFNMAALIGLGQLTEVVGHRTFVPLVFLVSAITGSAFSLIFMPNTTSVGASGGIMGLLGFLLVLSWRQKDFIPIQFLRTLLISVMYTALAGVIAYGVIDNAAHGGGLVAGVLLGYILLPTRKGAIPSHVSRTVEYAGWLAGGILLIGGIFCLLTIVLGPF